MGGFSLIAENEDDFKEIESIMSHPDIMQFLVKDKYDIKSQMNGFKRYPFECYMLKFDEKTIGFCVVLLFNSIKVACVNIGSLKEYRGKVLKEACLNCLDLFRSRYPLFTVFSRVDKSNRASLFFSKMIGLKHFAKIGNSEILRLKHV